MLTTSQVVTIVTIVIVAVIVIVPLTRVIIHKLRNLREWKGPGEMNTTTQRNQDALWKLNLNYARRILNVGTGGSTAWQQQAIAIATLATNQGILLQPTPPVTVHAPPVVDAIPFPNNPGPGEMMTTKRKRNEQNNTMRNARHIRQSLGLTTKNATPALQNTVRWFARTTASQGVAVPQAAAGVPLGQALQEQQQG